MINASESEIQRAVIEYLKIMENMGHLLFIRNNSFSGKIMRKDTSVGYIKNSKKGSPDILILFPNKFVQVELKTRIGKLSKAQEEWQKKSEKLGHVFKIARSVDDVERIVKTYAKTI